MEVMVARGAGLDVAKKSVVVCVLAGEPGTVVVPEIKTFGTMTVDLERGNRLELPWLGGKVVALGKQLGVPTPVLAVMYAALKPYANGAPE